MAGETSSESPLEAAAGMANERTTNTFSLLANETRLAILLALWEAEEPFSEGQWDPTEGDFVPFSELRERVDVRDSGRFNYHLGQMEGIFIEKTGNGYHLLPTGSKIVRTIIADSAYGEEILEPSPIDLNCWYCGGATAITYQYQRLYHVCLECDGGFDLGRKHPSGALAGTVENPAALTDRTPEEIYAAGETNGFLDFRKRAAGLCPKCTGLIDSWLDVCDDHAPTEDEPCSTCGRQSRSTARSVCTVCKAASTQTIELYSGHHPELIAFAWKHGYDMFDRNTETMHWIAQINAEADQEILSTDPLRLRVTFRSNGDEVQLTYDEKLDVVDVTGDY